MKQIVITFGLISGAIVSLMMLVTVPFADRIGFDKSEIIGYTTLVLSFLLVFFGFFNVGITFIEPFPLGLVMTLISAAILRKRSKAS